MRFPILATALFVALPAIVANGQSTVSGRVVLLPIVNCTGQWRSDHMVFTLQQSFNGRVTGRFGRPNQAQVGEVIGHVDHDKLLLKFRTPAGNGDIEWRLIEDSKAIVRWRRSSSTRSEWDGQYRVARHGSVPPRPTKTDPLQVVAHTHPSPSQGTQIENFRADALQRRRRRSPRNEYRSSETPSRQVAQDNSSDNRNSVEATQKNERNAKPVEKVQVPNFASMNLLRTLPDYYGVQGTWQTVREMKNGKHGIPTYRLTLDGKTIKFQTAGGKTIEEHPYLIDTAATPYRLETFVAEDAPEMLSKAIYKLEGDILTLCMSEDSQAYPDEFVTHPGDERRWLLLERVVDSTESRHLGRRVIDDILADASGTTGRTDERRAATALVKLADEGDTLGRMWLAHCLFTGRLTFVKDRELAETIANSVFDDVRQLANRGDSHALFLMGAAFDDGLREVQDRSQAKTWYLAASEKGHPWAMHRLSRLLRRDDRYEEAIKWERLASELGYAASINKLGEFYYEGWAVPKDKEQSRQYSEIAAQAGFHRAMANLGAGYFIRGNRELDSEFGTDEKKVLDALALKWHRRAAEAASPTGMFLLGIRYRAGQVGLDEDDEKGLLWYRRSALAGNNDARKKLASLDDQWKFSPGRNPSPFSHQMAALRNAFEGQPRRNSYSQSRYSGPGWNEDQRYEEYKARQLRTEHWQRFNQNVAPGFQPIPRSALGLRP